MKHVLSLTFCLLSIALLSQQKSSVTVLFDTDSDLLTTENQSKLAEFAELYYTPHAKVRIVGHTDQDGSHSYNLDLSKRRAQAVSEYFGALDVHTSTLDYSGESMLAVRGSDEDDKQRNRRVEVFFVDDHSPDTSSLEELKRSLIPDAQVFLINNDEDTVIVCEAGTVFRFPKDCFETFDGPMVRLEVIEALDLVDMYLSNLGTEGGPNMLSSGGMLRAQAFQNDVEIGFRQDEAAAVYMPTNNPDPGMGLYYADSDGALQDWEFEEDAEVVISRPFIQQDAIAEIQLKKGKEKCKFFWCRLERAFQRKANRAVLDDEGNYVVTEYDSRYQEARSYPSAETSLFGDEATQEVWAAIHVSQNEENSGATYLAFPMQRMNWINCDMLRPAFQEDVLVRHGYSEGAMEATLMFPGDNSITRQYGKGSSTTFRNMPKLKKVYVVCLKVEDKQPYLAMKKTRVNSDKVDDLDWEPMAADDIGKAIKEFIN